MIPAIVLYAIMIWQQEQKLDPALMRCPDGENCAIKNIGINTIGPQTSGPITWQQGQERAQKITPTTDAPVWNLNENSPGCAPLHTDRLHGGWFLGVDDKGCYIEIAPPPPFDVPPVETRTSEEHCEFEVVDGAWHQCMGGKTFTQERVSRACADKSRFLLMSEDNVWHCLSLRQKP